MAEARLKSILTERGFDIVEPLGELPGILKAAISDRPYLSPNEAANLGIHFKADVVVFGKAAVEQGQSTLGSDLQTFQGTLDLSATRTDTGEELASVNQTQIVAEADDITGTAAAFAETAGAAADELTAGLTTAWEQVAKSTRSIEIGVTVPAT